MPPLADPNTLAPLTDEELASLRRWQPDFLELPVHELARFQFERGKEGVESTVILGEPGVGKTHALEQLTRESDDAEMARARETDGAHVPRRIFRFTASTATGRKTLLVDTYQALTQRDLAAGARRAWTPRQLIERVVDELVAEQYHLLIVDEAQHADAANLDQLRQVPDVAAERGHPMGLILAGTEGLRDALVETGQLGQRFSSEIRFPRITRGEVGPFLPEFHPHLPALQEALGAKRWAALMDDLFAAIHGKFRRLTKILTNANALTVQRRHRMTEEIVRVAIDKLAPEQ